MVITSNNKLPIKENNKKYIFLAGSIDNKLSGNWRKQFIDKLDSKDSFFDPTHDKHDNLNEKEMIAHIEWELEALSMSDKIILNFLPNALSPISLVELGLYVASKKLLVICPKEFYKSRYVYTLCKKHNTPIFLNLEEAINTLT